MRGHCAQVNIPRSLIVLFFLLNFEKVDGSAPVGKGEKRPRSTDEGSKAGGKVNDKGGGKGGKGDQGGDGGKGGKGGQGGKGATGESGKDGQGLLRAVARPNVEALATREKWSASKKKRERAKLKASSRAAGASS